MQFLNRGYAGRGRSVLVAALYAGAAMLVLTGCQTAGGFGGDSTGSLYSSISPEKIDTESRKIAAEGLKAIDENRLDDATKAFNFALKLEITNSYLQYLNGLTYHLRALRGDASLYPLAEQGYKLAIRFDGTNWMARYQLGLLYLDQRKFVRAQGQIADALLYNGDNPDLLYSLAYASYYAQDPVRAAGALKRLREVLRDGKAVAKVLRASTLTMAALDQTAAAESYLANYSEVASPDRVSEVTRRMSDWRRLYDRYGEIQQAQAYPGQPGFGFPPGQEIQEMNQPPPGMGGPFGQQEMGGQFGQQGQAGAGMGDENSRKMVIVDVVIIRTEEDITTSKGFNLLNGLQLQFGDPGLPTSTFSFGTNRIKDRVNPSNDVNSTTLTSLIGIPSVTYSLNIANSNTARNEILARPSLVARHGVTSEFFSGVEIAAAAVSGGDGDSVSIEKEVGVKLAITPEFLDNGMINLQVVAERTFLTTPSSSVVFDFRLDTSKTSVNANVVMRFGETLILSGLSEKETERNRDGVPFLQDIPILQYFFSNAQTRDFRKSVLILITPRPAPYVYRSDAAKAAAQEKMSDEEKALTELQARYSDWFQTYPNWGAVFHQMQENQLYREFRTGDVAAEKWNSGQSHEDRLKRAKEFLFY